MQTLDGVPAERLTMAIQTLQQTLDDFRRDLDRGEQAFEQWRSDWAAREACLGRRLEALSRRVGTGRAARSQLRVVAADS